MDRVIVAGALQGYQCASSRSKYVRFVYIVSDFLKCFLLVCVPLEQVNRFVFAAHVSGLKSHCTIMNAFCGSFETQYGAFIEDACQLY